MSESTSLWVAGEPKPQPRVKAYSRGGLTRVYTPATAQAWKQQIIASCAEKGIIGLKINSPVSLRLVFFLPRPKSGKKNQQYTIKPDIDNLVKAAMDALTVAEVWRDDCLIVKLVADKRYEGDGTPPGCLIEIGYDAAAI